ncbi:unnamed protein product, partial [Nesidiocoris tenuis]
MRKREEDREANRGIGRQRRKRTKRRRRSWTVMTRLIRPKLISPILDRLEPVLQLIFFDLSLGCMQFLSQEVQEEVRKVNKNEEGEKGNSGGGGAGSGGGGGGVVIMTGVAKKNIDLKNKGELIEQNQDGLEIGKETRKFTKSLNLRVVCVYGGTGISEQIAELKRGAEIIVCTPGRMIDMLAANS